MELAQFFTGPEAKLSDVLSNREAREWRQREYLNVYAVPLISFSLNIAGPYKRPFLADRAFAVGRAEVEARLAGNGWPVRACVQTRSDCTIECLWAVQAPPLALKSVTAQLEESHPLGRLFDLDVIDLDGAKLQRTQAGYPPRRCLVCGRDGMGCARSRTHDLTQLQAATLTILRDFFDRELADTLAQLSVKALLYEVSVTPKPGLVDRLNTGAHRDMDFTSFLDSACALLPYFKELVQVTLSHAHTPPGELLQWLRLPGIKAESAMYRATHQVNTHKGAIYSLGILCAAYAYAYANGTEMTPPRIFELCALIAAPSREALRTDHPATAGEQIYHRHGISGIRGEAAGGFPAVAATGLPVYRQALAQGLSHNDAGVIALLHMIPRLEDTNAIKRVGLEQAQAIKAEVAQAVEALSTQELLALAHTLDSQFTKQNLSFGGAADMLALTVAVELIDGWRLAE